MTEVAARGVGASAVRLVWDELMPGCTFDENLTWNEAGVDSLKSLHYLLRLEELTGQKVSFDLLAREMTLKDLSDALLSRTPAPHQTSKRQRTVFLFPGIFGEGPGTGSLRNALRAEVSWETLEIADLRQSGAVLADIGKTTATLVEEIVQRQPEGAIALAGYSFGGFLAYQAALELEAAGRHVDLLCLLDTLTSATEEKPKDTNSSSSKEAQVPKLLERFRPKAAEKPHAYLERIAFRLCQKYKLLELARRIVIFSWPRYSFAKGQARRNDLIWAFRVRAMRSWRPRPCSAPTLLIASDDCMSGKSHLAWSALCPNLTIRYVGGDHEGIFEPGPMAVLVPALRSALGLDTTTSSTNEWADSSSQRPWPTLESLQTVSS